jgi:hypothetical protein
MAIAAAQPSPIARHSLTSMIALLEIEP